MGQSHGIITRGSHGHRRLRDTVTELTAVKEEFKKLQVNNLAALSAFNLVLVRRRLIESRSPIQINDNP